MNIKSFLLTKILLSFTLSICFLGFVSKVYADPAIPMYHLIQTELSDSSITFTINFTPDQTKAFQIFESIDTNNNKYLDDQELNTYSINYSDRFLVTLNDQKLKNHVNKVEATTRDEPSFVNNPDSSFYNLIVLTLSTTIPKVDNVENLQMEDKNSFDGTDSYGYLPPLTLEDISITCVNSISSNVIDIKFTTNELSKTTNCDSKPFVKEIKNSVNKTNSNYLTKIANDIVSNPISIFLGLIIAFFLGLLHALQPGHAKTIILLTSNNIKARNVRILVLTTCFVHGFSDILLGFLIILFSELLKVILNVNQIVNFLGILTGIIIVLYGIYYSTNYSKQKYSVNDFDVDTKPLTSRKSILLGALSGIAPSPLAISTIVYSYVINKLYIGIIIVLFFSIGFSITILSLSFLSKFINKYIDKHFTKHKNLLTYKYIIFGILIILSGMFTIYQFSVLTL